jgi:hypothetical protein
VGHGPSAETLGAELAASKRAKSHSLRNRLLDRVLSTVNPNRKSEG